jgi:hypothetical protein
MTALAYRIFDASCRGGEGLMYGDPEILVGVMLLRAGAHGNILARNFDIYGDLVKAALPLTAMGGLNHDPASHDAWVETG